MKLQQLLLACLITFNANAQSYQKLHDKAILLDTHNDILAKVLETGFLLDQDLTGKTQSDLNRWKKGGMDLQFFQYGVMETALVLLPMP
jgi:membrane dipeptidase